MGQKSQDQAPKDSEHSKSLASIFYSNEDFRGFCPQKLGYYAGGKC